MKKKKVGIITWHYFPNFGSALQAYALQSTVESLGYKVKILNYRDEKYGKRNRIKCYVQCLLHIIFSKNERLSSRFCYPFQYFQKKYLNETRIVKDSHQLSAISRHFDCIICGSDQIWAPNVLNPIYLLNFVPEGVKKLSYAASIGLDRIPEKLIPQYAEAISDFHFVSVRESTGAGILKETCGISAEVVLDPTLLVRAAQWEKLENVGGVKNKIGDKKYVFCYFLKPDHEYKNNVLKYAEKNGLNIIGCSQNQEDALWMNKLLKGIGPKEFLWLIHHAEVVLTDSYHGTIFSLLFHKRFVTLERFLNNDEICQNSRIYQLRTYFNLENQIIPYDKDVLWNPEKVDYDKFEQTLKTLRKNSTDFLKNALK